MPIEPDKAERVSELRVPLPKLVREQMLPHVIRAMKERAA